MWYFLQEKLVKSKHCPHLFTSLITNSYMKFWNYQFMISSQAFFKCTFFKLVKITSFTPFPRVILQSVLLGILLQKHEFSIFLYVFNKQIISAALWKCIVFCFLVIQTHIQCSFKCFSCRKMASFSETLVCLKKNPSL